MTITVSVDISASLARVWEALADLGSHTEWMADAKSIEFVGVQRADVGTRLVVASKVGPFRTSDIIEVMGWEEARRIGVRHLGRVTGEGEVRLAAIAGGTRLTWTERLRLPSYLGGRMTGALARPVLAWVFRRNLHRLQRLLETRVGSGSAD